MAYAKSDNNQCRADLFVKKTASLREKTIGQQVLQQGLPLLLHIALSVMCFFIVNHWRKYGLERLKDQCEKPQTAVTFS
ncbi:hypothetical protein AAVH_08293 [Aphelenchoides avenae]|nr:hypothetical protein AAVH_08293 [Aphelenchus avenae]